MTDGGVDILQVVTDTNRRGGQVFGLDLQAALQARGRVVRTVALAPGTQDHLLPLAALGPTRLGAGTLRALRALMRASPVTVAHGSATLPACALAGAGLRTPFVYRNVGDPLYWANTLARRVRVRAFLSRAAAVAALWPGSARVLVEELGVAADKVRVIPNGVPAARFPPVDPTARPEARAAHGLQPHRPTVVYVGALSPEKDLPALIGAVAALDDVQLLVAGDGPLRRDVQRLADERAPGRTSFIGATASPHAAFAAGDVVALPSRSEGLPAVLIEAGLSGLPAVATDVGGVAEIVTPASGRLVPPGDDRALVAALDDALRHAEALGAAARAHCLARFEIGVVAGAWDDLLAAVERRPGGGA